MLVAFIGPALNAVSRMRRRGVTMDRDKQLGTAIVGGLDNLLQVCTICRGLVHCGIMDGMAELLQFGDKGFDDGAVNLALTKAFVFGSVAYACCRVPGIDRDSYSSHLLSFVMSSKYKR